MTRFYATPEETVAQLKALGLRGERFEDYVDGEYNVPPCQNDRCRDKHCEEHGEYVPHKFDVRMASSIEVVLWTPAINPDVLPLDYFLINERTQGGDDSGYFFSELVEKAKTEATLVHATDCECK